MNTNIAVRFSNYEDCLIGVAESFDDVVYAYDKEKILAKIMKTLGCDYKEALGFFEINLKKSFGSRSPVFVSSINVLEV